MSDDLSRQLARLYDQEREERNERRGLEQRAAAVLSAFLVTLGLIVNAASNLSIEFATSSGWLLLLGGILSIVGLLAVTLALTGAHTTENLSVWQAVVPPKGAAAPVQLEPKPLTADYVSDRQRRVSRLIERNTRLVILVRIASFALGIAVYLAVFAVGVEVVQ